MLFLLTLLFIICTNQILTFDDITIIGYPVYQPLVQPYNSYIFKRINTPYTGYIDDHLPVNNITNYKIYYPTIPFYDNAAVSLPNFIFTTGENLSITKSNNIFFDFIDLYMTSIFIDNMAVTISGYKNGRIVKVTNTNLPVSVSQKVTLNWKNLDTVVIGCTNPDPNVCAHIAYDNVQVI